MQTNPESLKVMPSGFIVRWFSSSPIPAGWFLCDGSNNTPNLVKCFTLVDNRTDPAHFVNLDQQFSSSQKIVFIMKN